MKKLEEVFALFLQMMVIGGALFATFQFSSALTTSESAPQQAAGSAMALCYAVIPYVFARAFEMYESWGS